MAASEGVKATAVERFVTRLLIAGFAVLMSGQACWGESSVLERASVTELWEPVPEMVRPGPGGGAPPSDAIVLFDGSNLEHWMTASGGDATWQLNDDGSMTVTSAGDIHTRREFGDVQLHVEWRTPTQTQGSGQGRGNSGVFLMSRYEVQVLDSFDNLTYANGQAASVYKQHSPLVNASRGPGEWQAYDIIFSAPRFGVSGGLLQPATLTVLHNGVLVQNHVSLAGPTVFIGVSRYQPHGKAPLRLQDHRNPVSYRNIWIREL